MTPTPLLLLALAALGGGDRPTQWFPRADAAAPDSAAPRAVTTSLRLVDLAMADERGYLGIYMEATDQGLEVTALMEGGPAEAAGIHAGDVITHVGAIRLSTPEGLEQLAKLQAGTKVLVKVRRGPGDREGVTDAVELRLQARPELAEEAETEPAPQIIEAIEMIRPGDPNQPWIPADSEEEIERKQQAAEEILQRLEAEQRREAEKLQALGGERRGNRARRAIRERREARGQEQEIGTDLLPAEELPAQIEVEVLGAGEDLPGDQPSEVRVQLLLENEEGEREERTIDLSLEDLALEGGSQPRIRVLQGDDGGRLRLVPGDHDGHGDHEDLHYEVIVLGDEFRAPHGDHEHDRGHEHEHEHRIEVRRPEVRTWVGEARGGAPLELDTLLEELPDDLPEGARMRIRRALEEGLGDVEIDVDVIERRDVPRLVDARDLARWAGGSSFVYVVEDLEGDCCGDCEDSCEEDDDCCGECEDSCDEDWDDDCGDCEDSCEEEDDCCGECEDSCDEDWGDDCGDCEDSCEEEDDCCGECEDSCDEDWDDDCCGDCEGDRHHDGHHEDHHEDHHGHHDDDRHHHDEGGCPFLEDHGEHVYHELEELVTSLVDERLEEHLHGMDEPRRRGRARDERRRERMDPRDEMIEELHRELENLHRELDMLHRELDEANARAEQAERGRRGDDERESKRAKQREKRAKKGQKKKAQDKKASKRR